MIKDKQKIKYMGTKVTVHFELKKWVEYEELPDKGKQYVSRWLSEKLDRPRSGWIVGFRSVQEGYTVECVHQGEDPGDYTVERYLHQIGRVEAVQVCYWPTMKPVLVPMDGFDSVDHGEPVSPARWAYDNLQEKNRAEISKLMKHWPGPDLRDSLTGRWK